MELPIIIKLKHPLKHGDEDVTELKNHVSLSPGIWPKRLKGGCLLATRCACCRTLPTFRCRW